MSAEDEDTTVRRFMEYLGAQDDGYEGSYEEWHWEAYGAEALSAAIRRLDAPKPEPEQVSLPCRSIWRCCHAGALWGSQRR